MKNHFIYVTIILLFSLGFLESAENFPIIKKCDKKLILDGVPNESFWQKAVELKLKEKVLPGKNVEPASVKIVHDNKFIFISAVMIDTSATGPGFLDNKYKLSKRYGVKQAGSDYLGVMLDLGMHGYFEYMNIFVDANGGFSSFGSWPKHASSITTGETFKNSIQVATKINKGKNWTVEIKIPWIDILRHPKEGIPDHIGMNFRRTQWGDDLKTVKPRYTWNQAIDRNKKLMRKHYTHMVSWNPMPSAEIWTTQALDIFFQFIFPDEIGILKVEGGTLKNIVMKGDVKNIISLKDINFSKSNFVGWNNIYRLQRFGDKRPQEFPKVKTEALFLTKPKFKIDNLKFNSSPQVKSTNESVTVSFELSQPADVLVSVLDKNDKVIKVLGHGLLGPRAPIPFVKNSLKQTLTWNYMNAAGEKVSKGAYRIEVASGLMPSVKRVIPMVLEKRDKAKWPQMLDLENMPKPNPSKKSIGKHDHGGGGGIHMAFDHEKNELYLPGYRVHDAESGEHKRTFTFRHPERTSNVASGELSIYQGNFYIAGWNEVWKVDNKAKPINFSSLNRTFIPNFFGGHSNPRRGQGMGPDGSLYIIHHYMPHGNKSTDISRIGPDGKILNFGLVNLHRLTASGLHVDSRGNIYVGVPIKPQLGSLPEEIKGNLSKFGNQVFGAIYGSIAKFQPSGGRLVWDKKAKALCGYRNAKGYKSSPLRLEGAEWVLPGMSPVLPRARGKSELRCPCRRGDFDIDEVDRIFIPDGIMGRVHIADPAGNVIMSIGQRGYDINKMHLKWPIYVVACKKYLFIGDFLHEKCLQISLKYKISEIVAIDTKAL